MKKIVINKGEAYPVFTFEETDSYNAVEMPDADFLAMEAAFREYERWQDRLAEMCGGS